MDNLVLGVNPGIGSTGYPQPEVFVVFAKDYF
jgi:hypothetical protein